MLIETATFEPMFAPVAFRHAVWLFPLAFALHIGEEYPRFTAWAQRFASDAFTHREYVSIHVAGLIGACACAAILSWPPRPHPFLVFAFLALVFLPAVFFNPMFHVGATVLHRAYCPGVVTAATVYPLIAFAVMRAALNESLIGGAGMLLALAVAGVFHAWEVGHNVFKAW